MLAASCSAAEAIQVPYGGDRVEKPDRTPGRWLRAKKTSARPAAESATGAEVGDQAPASAAAAGLVVVKVPPAASTAARAEAEAA
jgi:hypothetical protein